MPKKTKRQQTKAIAISRQFSGPIPPPEILGGYESIQTGAADRIIKMAEEQAHHRQKIEKTVIERETTNDMLGTILGFVLLSFLIALGGYLVVNGKDIYGLVSILSSPLALAWMTYSRKKSKKD